MRSVRLTHTNIAWGSNVIARDSGQLFCEGSNPRPNLLGLPANSEGVPSESHQTSSDGRTQMLATNAVIEGREFQPLFWMMAS